MVYNFPAAIVMWRYSAARLLLLKSGYFSPSSQVPFQSTLSIWKSENCVESNQVQHGCGVTEKKDQRVKLTNIITPHVLNTIPHAASLGPQIKPRIIKLCSIRKDKKLLLVYLQVKLLAAQSGDWEHRKFQGKSRITDFNIKSSVNLKYVKFYI